MCMDNTTNLYYFIISDITKTKKLDKKKEISILKHSSSVS
jgi:hypothetical protein